MARKSQKSKQWESDPSHIFERHCLDRRHDIYLVRKIYVDEQGPALQGKDGASRFHQLYGAGTAIRNGSYGASP